MIVLNFQGRGDGEGILTVGAFAALLTHVLLPPQTLGEGVTPLTLMLLTARLIPLISTLREIVARLGVLEKQQKNKHEIKTAT